MNTKIAAFFTLLLAGIATACEDFVEDRLDGKTVHIIAPTEGSIANTLTITFAWDSLKEATKYHAEIAVPNFQNAASLLLDTTILASDTIQRKTSFSFKLPQGSYQWRIQALSTGSSTPHSYATFAVDTTRR